MKLWILTITLLFPFSYLFCQVANPTPVPPQVGSLSPYQRNTPQTLPSLQQQRAAQTRRNNERLRQEVHRHQRDQLPEEELLPTIQYEFPSLAHKEGTAAYYNAFETIEQMLQGNRSLSLKDAVFQVEHAFLGHRVEKDWYESAIASHANLIREALEADGYKPTNEMAAKMMLHRFMSDTIKICGEDGTICNTSYPKRYDFTDIFGKEDWSKMFVTKLLNTGSGQCHSMPLLYLILAEELGVKAHLAFSPEHSYIKVQDSRGHWYNLELTNGHYSTDAWIVGSGYVKAEALSTGIYMEPLNQKEVVAHCLVDLAKGYTKKFGYDPFVLKCLQTALQYHPKNIFALQMQSDYYSLLFHRVVQQLGSPPLPILQKDKRAFDLYQKRNRLYDQIDATGFEPMPEDVYKSWLKSLEQQKHLQAKFPRA